MIHRKAVLLPILMILSIQAVIGSMVYFAKQSDKITTYLTSETGTVAGASTSEIIDLSKEIPLVPGAEISGVDTSQNTASVTIDSSLPEEEIKTYYDDYMLLNNWEQINDNEYQKENRILKIEISDNIIRITLTRI
jgi:hypothetical protein